MSWYEVMIHARKGYRFIVEADDPDKAYDKATARYDNCEEGDEGGFEDTTSIQVNLIEKPEEFA